MGVEFSPGRYPDDPEGTTLAIDLTIEDGAWAKYAGPKPRSGKLSRIGVLPRGMVSGRPAVELLVILDDGTAVIAETSWRNFALAAVALIARWGTP